MRRKTFFDQFFSLEDAEGRPLITTAPLLQGRPGLEPYLIAGRPVIFSSKVPANGVLYGDLSTYIVNESQEIVIEVDSSVGFATDTTMFRGKVYAGGSPLFATSTFAYYKKAS
jgi:HK97 family phage major capsid protein